MLSIGSKYKNARGATFSVLALFETMSDDLCVLLESSISDAQEHNTQYRFMVCFMEGNATDLSSSLGTRVFDNVDSAISCYNGMMETELAFDS